MDGGANVGNVVVGDGKNAPAVLPAVTMGGVPVRGGPLYIDPPGCGMLEVSGFLSIQQTNLQPPALVVLIYDEYSSSKGIFWFS